MPISRNGGKTENEEQSQPTWFFPKHSAYSRTYLIAYVLILAESIPAYSALSKLRFTRILSREIYEGLISDGELHTAGSGMIKSTTAIHYAEEAFFGRPP